MLREKWIWNKLKKKMIRVMVKAEDEDPITLFVQVDDDEFEGNIKNIYLEISSQMNVRFSVPNAVDTSELSSNKDVKLTFASHKAIVLPKGRLAVD